VKILITGGAGFIGSNLAHYLLALEGEVLIVDDLSTGKVENLDPRADFRCLDVRDEALVELARAWQPDVIVHLAAQISVAKSVAEPELTHSVNVDGTRRVAQAAVACGAERLVFASTAAVYGDPDPSLLPLVETCPTVPTNPYGASKLAAEQVIAETLRPAGVDFAIARLANVYGPRQGADGEGGVVSVFCNTLASGGKKLVINGDGKQTRDFVYVGDIVMGLVSMIGGDIAFAGTDGEEAAGIYHLSTGQTVSVEYLAQSMQRISRVFADFEYAEAREGDIYASVLNPEKALDVFEWQATIELELGLTKTWEWYKTQKVPG